MDTIDKISISVLSIAGIITLISCAILAIKYI